MRHFFRCLIYCSNMGTHTHRHTHTLLSVVMEVSWRYWFHSAVVKAKWTHLFSILAWPVAPSMQNFSHTSHSGTEAHTCWRFAFSGRLYLTDHISGTSPAATSKQCVIRLFGLLSCCRVRRHLPPVWLRWSASGHSATRPRPPRALHPWHDLRPQTGLPWAPLTGKHTHDIW